MSSSEYHDCMSEMFFTRGLVWFAFAEVAYEHIAYPLNVIFAIAFAINALSYLVLSYFEHREAE